MAPVSTIEAGVLSVASAFPDPPFEVEQDGVDTGLDAELMELVCGRLGLRRAPVRYGGDDFNGIFDGLRARTYDAVISGTTITRPTPSPTISSGTARSPASATTPMVASAMRWTTSPPGGSAGSSSFCRC
jgi:hypothetical protein